MTDLQTHLREALSAVAEATTARGRLPEVLARSGRLRLARPWMLAPVAFVLVLLVVGVPGLMFNDTGREGLSPAGTSAPETIVADTGGQGAGGGDTAVVVYEWVPYAGDPESEYGEFDTETLPRELLIPSVDGVVSYDSGPFRMVAEWDDQSVTVTEVDSGEASCLLVTSDGLATTVDGISDHVLCPSPEEATFGGLRMPGALLVEIPIESLVVAIFADDQPVAATGAGRWALLVWNPDRGTPTQVFALKGDESWRLQAPGG